MNSLNHNSRCGFSLIEVLVALLVVSIGLLGIAGMEIFSKQNNYEAVQRTTAVMLARGMMEKMRANPTALSTYSNITVGNASVATPGNDCKSSTCSEVQIATYDLWSWEQLLDGATEQSPSGANTGGLIQPQGCITTAVAAGAAGTYSVAIAWRGNSAMTNPTTSTCGQGSGLYGAADEYRRVMQIDFYITDNTFI